MAIRTFALTVAYDGTPYVGWQVQPNQRTVQGELERVLATLSSRHHDDVCARILGSGRTDAGVHSVGQVARCRLQWPADETALLRAFNSKLPNDILVRDVRETNERFHPIADAVSKRYRYQIQVGGPRDVFAHRIIHRVHRELDFDAMQQCADMLCGKIDFAAFQASGAVRESTVRTISISHWKPSEVPSPMAAAPATRDEHDTPGTSWVYEVEGDGFLYNMVRNLVGSMLEVGRGRRSVDWMRSVIDGRDRRQAGPTAPACGLTLWEVHYPPDVFLRQRDG